MIKLIMERMLHKHLLQHKNYNHDNDDDNNIIIIIIIMIIVMMISQSLLN